MNYLYCDFEFRSGTGKYFEKLICATAVIDSGAKRSWNLLEREGREDLFDFFQTVQEGDYCLVAYGINTEYRAINTLGIEFGVENFCDWCFGKYICLYRDYLCLSNKSKTLPWGNVIDSKGIKKYEPFNAKASGQDTRRYTNLANAAYKLLGDYDITHAGQKAYYHKLCTNAGTPQLTSEIPGIMRYCDMDTLLLPPLLRAIQQRLSKFIEIPEVSLKCQLNRGKYARLIGKKTQEGYHIDMASLINLIANRTAILGEITNHIARNWPKIPTVFHRRKDGEWSMKEKAVRLWIDRNATPAVKQTLEKTATKMWSLSEDSLGKLFSDKYNLDPNDYLAQIYRFKSMQKNIKGLDLYNGPTNTKSAKKMGHYIDKKTGWVHPYFNDYGSQTGRNQPSTNGYVWSKSAWLRVLLTPPPGHVMFLSDYTREEVLILAIQSEDANLYHDYMTGDIYSAFGLRAGILTPAMKGTPDWKLKRKACKETVLKIFYGATEIGLALGLSLVLKRQVTPGEARRYIEAFKTAYPRVAPWQDKFYAEYRKRGFAMLADGWILNSGNYNKRSIKNFPTQGAGGDVMRRADMLLDKAGLWCPLNNHDAFMVYSKAPKGVVNWSDAQTMLNCMRQGFIEGMGHSAASAIQMDLEVIGEVANPEDVVTYSGGQVTPKITKKYVDERAVREVEILSKYLSPFWRFQL